MNSLPTELRIKILTYASTMDDRIKRRSIGRLKAFISLKFERQTFAAIPSHVVTKACAGLFSISVHSYLDIAHTGVTYHFGQDLVREEYVGRLDRPPNYHEIWRYRRIDFPWAEDAWQPGQLYDPLGSNIFGASY